MGEVFLALDVGTTHVKALAARADGSWTQGSVKTPWHERQGRRVLDPAQLMGAIAQVVHESLSQFEPSDVRVAAVGVTSMGEAGLFVSERRPLNDIGAWQDVRGTEARYQELITRWEPQALFERTGIAPHPKFSLLRMRQERPADAFVGWLSVADYVIWALTGGARVTHPSLAARTMAYRWRERQWDAELLRWAGLEPAHMPTLQEDGAAVGPVVYTDDERLKGAWVVHAGHDHVAAAFGADLGTGQVLDSSGTAEPLVVRALEPVLSPLARQAQMAWGPSLFGDGSYIGLLPTPGGGACEAWARTTLNVSWAEIGALSAVPQTRVQFDATGWPQGAACWSGLGYDVDRLSLYGAVLDGVAESVAHRLKELEAISGQSYPALRVVGGVARHRLWLSVRARRLGRAQQVMDPPHAALIGALRAAARAVGQPCPVAVDWQVVGPADPS
jgi:xylulokinase